MLSFSEYGARLKSIKKLNAASYIHFSKYFEGEFVVKEINGRNQVVKRYPSPEVLCGTSLSFRQSLAALDFKFVYRSGVLTFDAQDIDVEAFNYGSILERIKIDKTIRLLREVIWPGIPNSNRPMLYITTHTHVGRLEINFAIPRYILSADNKVRSYNPYPPTRSKLPSKLWQRTQDTLNTRFDWVDPLDPCRRQEVKIPDWILKKNREAVRQGNAVETDIRLIILQHVKQEVRKGRILNRGDVLTFLEHFVKKYDWSVLSHNSHSITVGPIGSSPKSRIVLSGEIFGEKFCSDAHSKNYYLLVDIMQRKNKLAVADSDLLSAWKTRSQYNRKTFSNDRWPESVLDIDAILNMEVSPYELHIPARHHRHIGAASQGRTSNAKSEPDRKQAIGSTHAHRGALEGVRKGTHTDKPDDCGTGHTFNSSGKRMQRSPSSFDAANQDFAGIRRFTQFLLGIGGALNFFAITLKRISHLSGRLGHLLARDTLGQTLTTDLLERLNDTSLRFERIQHDRNHAAQSRTGDERLPARAGAVDGQLARHPSEGRRRENGQSGKPYPQSGKDHSWVEPGDRSRMQDPSNADKANRSDKGSGGFSTQSPSAFAVNGRQTGLERGYQRGTAANSERGSVGLTMAQLLAAGLEARSLLIENDVDAKLERRDDGFSLWLSLGRIHISARGISADPYLAPDLEQVAGVLETLVDYLSRRLTHPFNIVPPASENDDYAPAP